MSHRPARSSRVVAVLLAAPVALALAACGGSPVDSARGPAKSLQQSMDTLEPPPSDTRTFLSGQQVDDMCRTLLGSPTQLADPAGVTGSVTWKGTYYTKPRAGQQSSTPRVKNYAHLSCDVNVVGGNPSAVSVSMNVSRDDLVGSFAPGDGLFVSVSTKERVHFNVSRTPGKLSDPDGVKKWAETRALKA